MTYTPEQRKVALAMLIANEWSCVDLACHVNVLREALLRAFMEYDTREGITAATLTHIATVLEQTAPKESHQ
jgi:hypothetical protein